MHITQFLHSMRTLVSTLVLSQSFTLLDAQSTAFSEPEVIFYGKVCASQGPGNCTVLTSGTMVWTLTPPTGAPIEITTELEAYPNGMSYILRIPAERLVTGTVGSANTLPTNLASVSYARGNVTVNGTTYLISAATESNPNTLVYSNAKRGSIERVDLALSITGFVDSDNDGMSDDFENQYAGDGLNPNNSGDATGDIDGDGSNNLAEFLAGTDPNGFDYVTWSILPSSALTPAQRDKTFDKDADGMTNWFEFAIGANPSSSDKSFLSTVLQQSFVTAGSNRHFSLSFTKPAARRLGVVYAVEQNNTLTGAWKRVANGQVTLMQDTRSTLQARETAPVSGKGFLRLAADEP